MCNFVVIGGSQIATPYHQPHIQPGPMQQGHSTNSSQGMFT